MDAQRKTRILAGFAFAELEAHETSKRFGYWEKNRSIPEVFALIHRDAAIALESIKSNEKHSDKIPDYTVGEEKLADVIIRILDVSQGLGMHVAEALIAKMEYNEEFSKVIRKDY